MDLGAYVQIDDLSQIMRENGISVPRLRGLRMMKEEKSVDIQDMYKGIEQECIEDLCSSIPSWTPYSNMRCYSHATDRKIDYYTVHGDINWKRIRGKRRKILKTYIHNEKKRYERQYAIWNKYCGKEDILYIHARIGGGNWSYYGGSELSKQPWFIEKVDDAFDCTYCDIYAKISTMEND